MQRKPNATIQTEALIGFFLLLSFGVALAILASRNLYDDEILSLPIVTRNVQTILQFSSSADVHPPGMYLLAHFAWRIVRSYRWMNVIPTVVLYIGLTVFVRAVTPMLTTARILFLLVATLHPQLLLWGTSFRWYSWWTGLALVCITVALQPRSESPTITTARGACVGLMLACMFYLNYITLLFAVALLCAMIARYRRNPRNLAIAWGIGGAIFLVLAAPQFHTLMAVHMPRARGQSYALTTSLVRLTQSLTASEAYLPWHPLAIVSMAVFVCLFVISIFRRTKLRMPGALGALAVLGIAFFLLVAGTGLGGKPRSGLLLIPILAVAAAWGLDLLEPRFSAAALLLVAVWSGDGIVHMLGRYGLSKSMMIERPEQVVHFVRTDSAPGCAIVATYDPALSFAIAQANLPEEVLISPFPPPVGQHQTQNTVCAHPTFYGVESYLGGASQWEPTLATELRNAAQAIEGGWQTHRFNFDPDAARKRRLASLRGFGGDLKSTAEIPDYRYVVVSGPIAAPSVGTVRQALKDFSNTDQ